MSETKILSKEDLEMFPEYDNHYKVVKVEDESVGLKGYIAIHRNRKQFPALGATRIWNYQNEHEALRDALRLSRLMSYKSALAGLPYTGAKAALIDNSTAQANRKQLFKVYAQKVNELMGAFVTGTDVGVTNKDLDIMHSESSFMIGTGVDSGYFTAIGVLAGIKVALKHIYGSTDIAGHSFAIQGLGKTGWPLLKFLMKEKADKIYVTDINAHRAWLAKLRFPKVQIISPLKIYLQDVDVYCPCALSHAITSGKVPQLKCKIIAGSANNQLDEPKTGELLHKRGILYAPDFIINGAGIMSVVDQYENEEHDKSRIIKKIDNIAASLDMIFTESKEKNKAPNILADEIAENIISSYL